MAERIVNWKIVLLKRLKLKFDNKLIRFHEKLFLLIHLVPPAIPSKTIFYNSRRQWWLGALIIDKALHNRVFHNTQIWQYLKICEKKSNDWICNQQLFLSGGIGRDVMDTYFGFVHDPPNSQVHLKLSI